MTHPRAWIFRHPDLATGGRLPGLDKSPSGGIQLTDEAGAIRQSILLLLSTRPGERVMRPEYGCDLYRLVFSPNDGTTAGLAEYYVREAIQRWERRVWDLKLDASADREERSLLVISMTYRLRDFEQGDALTFPLQLS